MSVDRKRCKNLPIDSKEVLDGFQFLSQILVILGQSGSVSYVGTYICGQRKNLAFKLRSLGYFREEDILTAVSSIKKTKISVDFLMPDSCEKNPIIFIPIIRSRRQPTPAQKTPEVA